MHEAPALSLLPALPLLDGHRERNLEVTRGNGREVSSVLDTLGLRLGSSGDRKIIPQVMQILVPGWGRGGNHICIDGIYKSLCINTV